MGIRDQHQPRQYHVIGDSVYYGSILVYHVVTDTLNPPQCIKPAQAIADKLNEYYAK